MKKHITEYSYKELEEIPISNEDTDVIEDKLFRSFIVLPAVVSLRDKIKYMIINWLKKTFSWFNSYYLPEGLHDSGYRCIHVILIDENENLYKVTTWSDVIHLNGIGGYGDNWLTKYGEIPDKIEPIDWNIDCLTNSGCFRFFSHKHKFKIDSFIGSSFQIYGVKDENRSK